LNIYFELLNKPVFSIEDIDRYYNNIHSARSAVARLTKAGLVVKIRNNMYTCINGENKTTVANRYQIASSITSSSYISHHTAMEYYGLSNQVYYDVYVSSKTPFRDFEFDGYSYRFIKSRGLDGVVCPKYSGGIKITDLERTVLDSIKDMDKISGVEEVIETISGIEHLNEKKLLDYLSQYQNQFLYQKSGYILRIFSKQLNLSEEFFTTCKSKIKKSKRYISSDIQSGVYNDEWQLIVPESIVNMMNGGTEYASI